MVDKKSFLTNIIDGTKFGWSVIMIIIVLFGIFVTYSTFNHYIESLVENKLNDPEFIAKLSKKIRPAIIFDEDKVITTNLGAREFIKKIDIARNDNGTITKIIVEFADYISTTPVLECLNNGYQVTYQRGEMDCWIFNLQLIYETGDMKHIFRLEINPY